MQSEHAFLKMAHLKARGPAARAGDAESNALREQGRLAVRVETSERYTKSQA